MNQQANQNREGQNRADRIEASDDKLVELSTESLQLVGGGMHIAFPPLHVASIQIR